jgi:ATP-dependent RNA helicase DeaD
MDNPSRPPSGNAAAPASFADLGLREPLLRALGDVGYEAPTPIQSATIPLLLAGRDLIGQAQTGTGKTAAFGLPLLQKLDIGDRAVQALVLTPTRELAIQVAEALHVYGRHLQGLVTLPVYGGQPLYPQQKRLERGVHVVVGTPGRLMDHLRRGTLRLDRVRMVVLDEADEMLRMGFIEDVEWILGQAPAASAGRQTALFSATMPPPVRRIAANYLHDPATLEGGRRSVTVPSIEQRWLLVPYQRKLEALTRLLETEETEAVLVFTRTKIAAAEVAEKLEARGYGVAAMHGDMNQAQRERTIEKLRAGALEIVVATDVAARGLDVERISHVVNFDIPSDAEAYVHRIGRTGRAGRSGKAVLFVTPRERRMLQEIERFTGRRIAPMTVPSAADVAARRKELFKDALRRAVESDDLELHMSMIEELVEEGLDLAELAAAAASLARRDRPVEADVVEPPPREPHQARDGMVRLFLDSGRLAGIRAGDIVGAIANEAGITGREIGAIDIHDRFSLVEIPERHHERVIERMSRASLRGRPVHIRRADEAEVEPPAAGGQRPLATARPGPSRRPGAQPKRPKPSRPPRRK